MLYLVERVIKLINRRTENMHSNTLTPIKKKIKKLGNQALFSGTSGRIKGNEHKVEYKFCLNIRKHFTVWVTEHRTPFLHGIPA